MQGPPEQVKKTSVAVVEFSVCDFFHAEALGFPEHLSVSFSGATPAGRRQYGYGRHTAPLDSIFEKPAAGDRSFDHLIFLLKEN